MSLGRLPGDEGHRNRLPAAGDLAGGAGCPDPDRDRSAAKHTIRRLNGSLRFIPASAP